MDFQAHVKGCLAGKSEGSLPMVREDHEEYFVSLFYNVFWVYHVAVLKNLEPVLECSHKVKMDHFNIENF